MGTNCGSYAELPYDSGVTVSGKDEYLQGYDDGLAKGKRDAKFHRQGVHLAYLIAIGFALVILGFAKCGMSVEESHERVIENRCVNMCEPFRMESCGHEARTATCRTPEGFIVRSEK